MLSFGAESGSGDGLCAIVVVATLEFTEVWTPLATFVGQWHSSSRRMQFEQMGFFSSHYDNAVRAITRRTCNERTLL